jgi:hypothetical protein
MLNRGCGRVAGPESTPASVIRQCDVQLRTHSHSLCHIGSHPADSAFCTVPSVNAAMTVPCTCMYMHCAASLPLCIDLVRLTIPKQAQIKASSL